VQEARGASRAASLQRAYEGGGGSARKRHPSTCRRLNKKTPPGGSPAAAALLEKQPQLQLQLQPSQSPSELIFDLFDLVCLLESDIGYLDYFDYIKFLNSLYRQHVSGSKASTPQSTKADTPVSGTKREVLYSDDDVD